jgi:hypothetical protein
MSRAYEVTVVAKSKKAQKAVDAFFENALDWFHGEATTDCNLCGGESELEFADRLHDFVRAPVTIRLTCLETLPYEEYVYE